ncbi:MAG: site-specific integrase [Treponema sp.]|jgi:integrase|nr:site-specific integrase [Treponema sp.]
MAKLPFSVFRRAGRRFYSVAFKNEKTGEYLPAISTKQETESGAVSTAFQWLKEGIPRQGGTVPLRKYSLRDMARKADISPADCEFICKELKRRGLLKSYVLPESKQAVDLTEYLLGFWDWEKSDYIRERLRKNHGLHRNHVIEMAAIIQKYWTPFFKGRMLGEITRQDIEDFIAYIETLKDKAREEQERIDKALDEEAVREKAEVATGLRKPKRKNAASPKRPVIRFPASAKRKNIIIQAGTIALKWAFHKELIDRDITAGITWFSGKVKERQILTPELAAAVFRVPWKDERARLANMLAMVTGMRAGEIQGLRVQDIGKDCLYVRHSWNFIDGLKTTKNNEPRTVEVPFPSIMQELLDLAGRNPHGVSMDSYIFWAELSSDKPIEADIFLRDFRAALVRTGMSKNTAKVYTFHAWRHYFSAYMRERVNEKLLQSQTGHKTLAMLEHYSDHRKAGDRERIQTAQIAAFGELIPSGAVRVEELVVSG